METGITPPSTRGHDPVEGYPADQTIPLFVSLTGSFHFHPFLKLRLESPENENPPAQPGE